MVTHFLGAEAARQLNALGGDISANVTEIRLRADKPMVITFSRHGTKEISAPYIPTSADIAETMERISRYSCYAFESELAQGYITLPGGHRVGVAGQAVVEGGTVMAWRHIGSLAIRIAHSVKGCANEVLPFIYAGTRFFNTMVISPPGFGKTTLLRDIVRQISDAGLTVGLVDERSEVAGCYQGVPQNDVGKRTDVLDACPKAEGMVMLLRAMSPNVVAVDELGGEKDASAVEQALNAGVKLLCTAHGYGVEDIRKNPSMARLIKRDAFERFVVLDAPGRIQGVYTKEGDLC
ncbi:MAG: stage III sporulation protein AA [Defluviitaleaceae bacterium]|nr:stage III sporulation protein AA [Defluviitaleaceae bacterium]